MDAVGCNSLLVHSHSSVFLSLPLTCGGSIAPTGPGHHQNSPANSMRRFTDVKIRMRAKPAWYGSSTIRIRCVANASPFLPSAQPRVASLIPQWCAWEPSIQAQGNMGVPIDVVPHPDPLKLAGSSWRGCSTGCSDHPNAMPLQSHPLHIVSDRTHNGDASNSIETKHTQAGRACQSPCFSYCNCRRHPSNVAGRLLYLHTRDLPHAKI